MTVDDAIAIVEGEARFCEFQSGDDAHKEGYELFCSRKAQAPRMVVAELRRLQAQQGGEA